VAGVLTAAQKKRDVVVAARALEAGTKLSLADVEVAQVHAAAVRDGAFERPEEVVGLVSTVQRVPGDQLSADMVGDAAQNALAQALAPGHRAVAIHVDQASGLAGLLRPGDTVSAIGIIDPTQLGGMATTHATGANAKVMLSGLKVLFVPYEFRYREVSAEEGGGGLSPVMSTAGGRDEGVIVLSVPLAPITVTWQITAPALPAPASEVTGTTPITATREITATPARTPASDTTDPPPSVENPGVRVSPVELLTLLDARASAVYLAMEPAERGDEIETPGVYLIDLLPGAAQTDLPPDVVFAGGER
jgi:hypothetical protein